MRAGYASVGRYATVVIAPLAVAYGLIAVGIAARHGMFTTYAGASTAAAACELTAGWAIIGVGLAAWWRRPGAPVGPLAVVAGLAWFSPDWIGWEAGPGIVRALGVAAQGLTFAVVVQVALAAPTGRPPSVPARNVIAATWVAIVLIALGRVLFYDPFRDPGCVMWCTANPLLLDGSRTIARGLDWADLGLGALAGLAVAGLGARRLAAAASATRRSVWPVVVPGVVFVAAWTVRVAVVAITPGEDPARPILIASFVARAFGLCGISIGLSWSLIRAARGTMALRRLARRADSGSGEGSLETVLGRATGDPSLRLAFPLPDGGWIDANGAEMSPPQRRRGRAVTTIVRAGQPIAAVLHDPAIVDGDLLRHEIGSAAQLGIDNERLRAQALVALRELKASRLRIVEAGDAERRTLERDLHDGAQQRLVGLSIALRMAQSTFDASGYRDAGGSVRDAGVALGDAISELRDLARGIHPAELTDEGLGAAIEALADESPMLIGELPAERLAASLEIAAYVLVQEAARRAAARADGSVPEVNVRVADGTLIVEVDDRGERSPQRALADLLWVADRMRALEGQLTVEPAPRGGVLIEAVLPCA